MLGGGRAQQLQIHAAALFLASQMVRLSEACGTAISGMARSNSAGMASMDGFSAPQGPPGLWRIQVQDASIAPHFNPATAAIDLNVLPRVAHVEVLSAWDIRRPVAVRAPLLTQPVVRLLGLSGAPVKGAICVAYSSDRPDLHHPGSLAMCVCTPLPYQGSR